MEQEKETFKAFIQSCLDFVVNNKKEEKVENEDVDKRKLIDEVAGMMKSAGCDDEVIRTAIGKMEKIGYDKSEAKTADNEDEKAEEEKEDKKEDKAENKCKNKADEEAEDKKCDNSKEVDYMAEVAKVSTEVKNEAETPVEYVSRADKLQSAIDYFKVN